MARITISYRRDDSGLITGRIFDRLVAHYGRDAIFRDIDDVPLGVDFRDHIGNVLAASDIVLAIVGPRWLGSRGGQTRLNDESDPVRVEIEAALIRGVPLIPVLVMRATMPQASQLPEPVRDFAFRNAVQVDGGQDFDVHIARLVRALDRLLEQKHSMAPAKSPEDAALSATPEPVPTGEQPTTVSRAIDAAGGVSLPSGRSSSSSAPRSKHHGAIIGTALAAALIGALSGIGGQRYVTGPAAMAPTAGAATADSQGIALRQALKRATEAEKELVARKDADAATAARASEADERIRSLANQLATANAAQRQALDEIEKLKAQAAAGSRPVERPAEARTAPTAPSSEWLSEFAAARNIPLPPDLRIVPPAPDVPREFARFSGAWGGDSKWNGRCRIVLLIVETVDTTGRAAVVHAEGPGEQGCYGNNTPWVRRLNATIRGDTMVYSTGSGFERRFVWANDNQLNGFTAANPNAKPPFSGAVISISRLN